ncbi:hypothetical protein [Cellvibrio sp. UBA7661]|uniref:hypothetical protein n=1 Tax=Cellvibrio sp. UBA7661 TaxID=1946311 RepID=UPI002F352632
MKKYFFIFCALLSSSVMASSYTHYSTSSYVHLNFTNGNPGSGLCIGGEICGKNDSLKIIYQPNRYISTVAVGAHDKVGDKFKAHLIVIADGVVVGEQDVLKDGSTLSFSVNRNVSVLEFKSVHENHEPKGDETVIMDVVTY